MLTIVKEVITLWEFNLYNNFERYYLNTVSNITKNILLQTKHNQISVLLL